MATKKLIAPASADGLKWYQSTYMGFTIRVEANNQEEAEEAIKLTKKNFDKAITEQPEQEETNQDETN